MRNRGKEGKDDALFGNTKMQQKIKEAVVDVSFLLTRGYSEKSSVQLAGNRYRLNARQQQAVKGMCASSQQQTKRFQTQIKAKDLQNTAIIIDGFNLLIILESILSNAYVFKGKDHCFRDLSNVHGTYKQVKQTEIALHIIGSFFKVQKVKQVLWIFDKPISNSGRLKTLLYKIAKEHQYNWDVELDFNPDKRLSVSKEVVITSDAWILDRATHWFNLVEHLVDNNIIQANVVYCD